MGAASATLLERAANVTEDWDQSHRGPTLRKLFGAYGIEDLRALHRKYLADVVARCVDEAAAASYLDYDECQELVGLADAHQLFLWDLFSQQNELVDAKELLSVACIFSGARLEEKVQFLMEIFDASDCGSCGALTGSEVAKLLGMVCGVFSRCSGVVVRKKDVAAAVCAELPRLVPAYRVAVERADSQSDTVFQTQRLLGLAELTQMLHSVRQVCEALPVSQPPPVAILHTPRLETSSQATPIHSPTTSPAAHGSRLDMCKMFLSNVADNVDSCSSTTFGRASGSTSPASASVSMAPLPSAPSAAGGGRAAVRQLAAARRAECAEEVPAWMLESDSFPVLDCDHEDVSGCDSKTFVVPERARMVFHGDAFCSVIHDFSSFKRSFVKSVSYALGCQASQIEVLDVARDTKVSIEFLVRAAGVVRDKRDALDLLSALEIQISCGHSVFRKGSFGVYAECAELLIGASVCQRPATAPARERAPVSASLESSVPAASLTSPVGESAEYWENILTRRPTTAPSRGSLSDRRCAGNDTLENELKDLMLENARLRLEVPDCSQDRSGKELKSSLLHRSLSMTRLRSTTIPNAPSTSMSRSQSMTRLSPLCPSSRCTRDSEIGFLVPCR